MARNTSTVSDIRRLERKIAASKNTIMKERDKLRDLVAGLEQLVENCDNACSDLVDARLALVRAADDLSETL